MKYDVIVCGGGPSGINAAISAKRNGSNVLLIESSGILGGNATNGLVAPWMTFHKNNEHVVKGIAKELVDILVDRGESLGYVKDPLGFADTVTHVDIEGVKSLFFKMIESEGIDLLLHTFIYEAIMEKNQIVGVRTISKSGKLDFFGRVFIDATGDGDVSALSGCDFTFGRESDSLAQPMTMIFHIGNVDIKKLKNEIIANTDDFVIRDNYDYKYLAISGFFKKIEQAKNDNSLKLNRDRVLLFEEVRQGFVSVNMTRVQKKSGINIFELTQAEMEGVNCRID